MNISTIGSASAKKKVAGSRRMCTASLRATDAMRCNDAATDMDSLLLRSGQRHEHIFQARRGLANTRPLPELIQDGGGIGAVDFKSNRARRRHVRVVLELFGRAEGEQLA